MLSGSYLPKVSDPIVFVVDVLATAQRRNVSAKKVRDDLAGYRSSRQAWVDVYGASGQFRVDSTDMEPPARPQCKESVTVRGLLMKYS